jgi:pimeloyl-ACP methyl ester carboxylesterase
VELRINGMGKEAPVVLLHGLVPGTSMFDALALALGRTRRVVRISMAGYDGVAPPVDRYTMPESIDAVARALRKAGVNECSIVGFSGGGHRALALSSHPDLIVTHVVALAGYATLAQGQRDGLAALASAARDGADVGALAAHTMFSEAYALAHPKAVDAMRAALRMLSRETLAFELEAAAGCEDLRPRLASSRARVVARFGGADRAMPVERGDEIAAAATHAVAELVSAAGHSLLEEDAAETTASIFRALAS